MSRGSLPHRVSDASANRPELIEHAAERIGKSKDRRAVFEAIYYHKKRIKTVSEIVDVTSLPRIRVLQEANSLAKQEIIGKAKKDGRLAYEQVDFYQGNKKEILKRLNKPNNRRGLVTKRNPRVTVNVITQKSRGERASARFISVDQLDSFAKVQSVTPNPVGPTLSESVFKRGIQTIIGENGKFNDWGGEQNDLYTTWVRIKGKRCRAAFAFKGPGTKGKLVLKRMGKNGDQIQRLFKSPADLFFVQYYGDIDQSIIEEMEVHAKNRSASTGHVVYFGVIDGQDSKRIIKAYPKAFSGR